MGSSESKACEAPLNPDILSVITLSDSAVQRLPLESSESPTEQETRNQNIDDYWRDRLQCMDDAYSESKRLTEKEFKRLEFTIKKMAPGSGKLVCPRMIEDSESCYLAYKGQPLNCSHVVKKLELCLNTAMHESTKKKYEDDKRKENRRC